MISSSFQVFQIFAVLHITVPRFACSRRNNDTSAKEKGKKGRKKERKRREENHYAATKLAYKGLKQS